MGRKCEFNQDEHDYNKWEFEKRCAETCDYLAARRVLGKAEVRPEDVDDAIFAAGFYLARLLDGKTIDEAKAILAQAACQIEAANQVDVRRLYSLLHGE